ncbi:MAG: hypothetical protein K1X79_11255 [Oligoflexia bacterium]|nr:hypothetical protein [Oligoflexia bacterium]
MLKQVTTAVLTVFFLCACPMAMAQSTSTDADSRERLCMQMKELSEFYRSQSEQIKRLIPLCYEALNCASSEMAYETGSEYHQTRACVDSLRVVAPELQKLYDYLLKMYAYYDGLRLALCIKANDE